MVRSKSSDPDTVEDECEPMLKARPDPSQNKSRCRFIKWSSCYNESCSVRRRETMLWRSAVLGGMKRERLLDQCQR